ncbi:LCP family protein [Desulfitobacterium sp.]|uniref:LCP family protein n=1 Tax=Desulfitobacterium sp. TaxID=49981 RepID=UPI002BB4C883|nr:LCP family protein [Desulfitobacterium sp.]HVJ48159.1 LCP family protein [Desulfitobacterium sp.]
MLLILAAVTAVSGYFLYSRPSSMDNSPTLKGPEGVDMTNRVSVLLVGADQRSNSEEKFNTDSLILASIDPVDKRISLLSIPRDTRISISKHPYIKINSVASLKDMQTLEEVVTNLTGVPLAGYIQTNFSGFKQIIDTLGGITVDVEKDMYYETGDVTDGYINLKKGIQRLDGSQALQYARFRYDALADISRTARQQVVLKAVAKEMMQISTLPKLPWLIPQLNEAVNTNLSLGDMFKLSKAAVGFEKADIVSQTLPGKFLDLEGVSYWEVDPKAAKKVVSNLLQGITTAKVIEDQEVDLLKPVVTTPSKALPKVPGNNQDPNGQESTGYQEVEIKWPLGPDGGA